MVLLLRRGKITERGFGNDLAAAVYAFALVDGNEMTDELDTRPLFWTRLSFTLDDGGINAPYDETYGFSLQTERLKVRPSGYLSALNQDRLCGWSFRMRAPSGLSMRFPSASDAARYLMRELECVATEIDFTLESLKARLVRAALRNGAVCGFSVWIGL